MKRMNLKQTDSEKQIPAVGHELYPDGLLPAAAHQQVRANEEQLYTINQQLYTANRQLQANAQTLRLYQEAVENALDLMAGINIHYTYVFVNAAFENYFQLPREKICGKHLQDIMGLAEFTGLKPLLDRCFKGDRVQFEKKYVSEDNQEHTLSVNYYPLPDKRPEETIVILVVRDITDQRNLEKEREKVQRLESLGVIAGGIAHDFNNLLSGLFGYISLARTSGSITPDLARNLDGALQAFQRAKDLTQQLLTFAKGGDPIKKPMRIDDLLKKAVSFNLSGSNIRQAVSIDDNLWPVDIDEGQIHQVISNIVINARQAMPESGLLTVTARNCVVGSQDIPHVTPGRYVEIRIRDQGKGIAPQHIDKIFEPFFSTKEKGSGLGLSVSFSIMKKHNGYIKAASALNVGTVFSLYFPALSEQALEGLEKASPALLPGSGTVLIMDDEETIRIVTKELLEQHGYQVLTAPDGDTAVTMYRAALAEGKIINLFILDLTIRGGMGGKETIKQLKEIDPGVKAIISSGYSQEAIMSDPLSYGFCGVVTKPFQPNTLLLTMQQILNP
jgi:two-component system cell cycle sensor histidine kinase/response regulator CckA